MGHLWHVLPSHQGVCLMLLLLVGCPHKLLMWRITCQCILHFVSTDMLAGCSILQAGYMMRFGLVTAFYFMRCSISLCMCRVRVAVCLCNSHIVHACVLACMSPHLESFNARLGLLCTYASCAEHAHAVVLDM